MKESLRPCPPAGNWHLQALTAAPGACASRTKRGLDAEHRTHSDRRHARGSPASGLWEEGAGLRRRETRASARSDPPDLGGIPPVIDLSGQRVDPILQADVLYEQLQQVDGLTVVPVNRVVQVYQALCLPQVQTEEQAALVCEMLGVDALVIASVTVFDPFDPPKMGASLQLFRRGGYRRPLDVDPRELARRATLPQVSRHGSRGNRRIPAGGWYL